MTTQFDPRPGNTGTEEMRGVAKPTNFRRFYPWRKETDHLWASLTAAITLIAAGAVVLFEHTVVPRFDSFDAVAINIVLIGFFWVLSIAAIAVWGRRPPSDEAQAMGPRKSSTDEPRSL
ncbi:MAG: hypothetical protein E6J20_21060 [Chloroflexi bacterium]|nr:MAG: hypothetical protein E6J20_21060 [Chloroflexota bacterium]